jgi:hypothetical protein
MDKDLKRDYQRYVKLCEKYGEEPKSFYHSLKELNCGWLEHYDFLLVKEDIHYNR